MFSLYLLAETYYILESEGVTRIFTTIYKIVTKWNLAKAVVEGEILLNGASRSVTVGTNIRRVERHGCRGGVCNPWMNVGHSLAASRWIPCHVRRGHTWAAIVMAATVDHTPSYPLGPSCTWSERAATWMGKKARADRVLLAGVMGDLAGVEASPVRGGPLSVWARVVDPRRAELGDVVAWVGG
jgi:hypothetical protein